ncbi:unnamed protein product [Camellia sinensis]
MANETERVKLVAFKAAIDEDPFRALTSWNHSVLYCLWNGILCSRRHPDRVIGITLRSRGLVGLLSPHMVNLSFLKSLVLENNSFHGPIPRDGSLVPASNNGTQLQFIWWCNTYQPVALLVLEYMIC